MKVRVSRADPHHLHVRWAAPHTPNGPRASLAYEIRWTKTEASTVSTGTVVVQRNETRGSASSGRYNYYVDNLEANTTYTIHVSGQLSMEQVPSGLRAVPQRRSSSIQMNLTAVICRAKKG